MSLDKFKVEKTAGNLLSHFDPEAKIEIVVKEDNCLVNVESEISALLIGRHGETLEAMQHILRLLLAKEQEEFSPLVLDISSYRASREQELKDLALNLANKVKESGGSETMPHMSPYERRQIHMLIADMDGVQSASEGEEPYRRIVIRPSK